MLKRPDEPEPVSPYQETTPDHAARAGCGVLVGVLAAMSSIAYFDVRDGYVLLAIIAAFGVLAWFTRDWFWRHLLTIIRLIS
jgi:hypothetical protein